MSQQSDIYSSSLYEGDPIAAFNLQPTQATLTETPSSSYVNSDSLPRFTPQSNFDQQLLISASDSDFSHSPAIPGSLTSIRPDRFTEFVLYTNMNKEEFVNWWLQTTYGKNPGAKTFNWDRTGHLSEVWKHFDQIASVTDGFPKVKCQRCGKIFNHPGHTKGGTSSMGRHLKGEKCRRAAVQPQQSSIRQLMQDEVSPPLIGMIGIESSCRLANLRNVIAQ